MSGSRMNLPIENQEQGNPGTVLVSRKARCLSIVGTLHGFCHGNSHRRRRCILFLRVFSCVLNAGYILPGAGVNFQHVANFDKGGNANFEAGFEFYLFVDAGGCVASYGGFGADNF